MRDACRAVLAGDLACLRTAAQVMGQRSTPVRVGLEQFDCGGAPVAVQFGPWAASATWPGGVLVWLVPERGPSAPELLEWWRLVNVPGATCDEPWVLVCIEPDTGVPEAREFETIAAAVAAASPTGCAFRLGVTERTRRDRAGSLGRFIRTLVGQAP